MANTRKLKAKMVELGITQTDLAKRLGLAAPTVCQKINNIRPFSLKEADEVAEILHISDADFRTYFFDS